MSVYLGCVQTVMKQLTIESLTDCTFSCMQSKNLLENPSTTTLSGFNEKSIDSVVRMIVRVVCFHFIPSFYPKASPVFSCVNGALGAVHLIVAFIKRFKITASSIKKAPDEWNEVALNIHKGFA
ncbi:MAG: hypothetical protein ACRDF4_04205, partial [Rhabdochlamydiaceae bacterium]